MRTPQLNPSNDDRHALRDMERYQELQMEYDDAIIQLGERVTKGLVTPGELLRDRVILEEAKEELKISGQTTPSCEERVPGNSTPAESREHVKTPQARSVLGLPSIPLLQSLWSRYVKPSQSESPASVVAHRSEICTNNLVNLVRTLKKTSMRRIKFYQLFHIVTFGILPRVPYDKPAELSMVPRVRRRRSFKYDVVGSPPTRQHDLSLKWYKKNGPLLVKLANRVIPWLVTLTIVKNQSLQAQMEQAGTDLVDIAHYMYRYPRLSPGMDILHTLNAIDKYTLLLGNARKSFEENDASGGEKYLAEASEFMQSAHWQVVELTLSRAGRNKSAGHKDRKVVYGDIGVEFAVQTMKECNIHVDLSDQSLLDWKPLSDQGGFGDIYTATVPERVIKPDGSPFTLVKVVAKTPARNEVKRYGGDNPVIWKRITREARAQGNAHKDPHPNILRITACINISSLSIYPALVIPWCDGGDLIGYLTSTEVGYIDRLRLALEVAAGVAHLHNLKHPGPIIHGDLRSPNVLIHNGHVKLADFGLSYIPDADKGLTSNLRGNWRWLAPEIKEAIRNQTEYELTKESDMFSFGHVFLEAITSHYPFEDISDVNQLDDVPIDEYHTLTKYASTVLDVHWKYMVECWDESSYRPTATEAVEFLSESLRELSMRSDPPDPSEFVHTDT